MRLLTVRVLDFRCVEDSGECPITDVTCLVGKNESGKTAILKAMHKLNPPEAANESFDPARDYPRRKWRPDSRVPSDPPAVTTTWKLEDSDLELLDEYFGVRVVGDPVVTVTRDYDNDYYVELKTDEAALVKHMVGGLPTADRKPLAGSKTVEDLQEKLDEVEGRTAAQETLREELSSTYEDGFDDVVQEKIIEMLPTFLYFDEYLTLPGTVSVSAIAGRKKRNEMDERDRIFLALLSLAGTTLEKVHGATTFESFNASLRAVSNQITDQIFKYWSQNRHLDVELRLDHARTNDPAPYNEGYVFRTRINNRRHRADTSFDDRSRGFVWFFSFLVWFYQLKSTYGNNLVILLDEPGLSLHAKAQADLLRYINEELRPDHQVIYTTHSPFMIDPNDLLSARTVEDVVEKDRKTEVETFHGTKVSKEVLSTDPDTVSPLQRALGYELTQTLFVGRHTLLVEGPSDLLYLKWFSHQLEKGGGAGLDYRWNISVVGGIDRIPGFVSLFRGNGLHIAAIVDVQNGDGKKIENVRKILKDGHLLPVSEFSNQKEADIEDVMGREFYVALVNRAMRLQSPDEVPAKKPKDAPERVAKEVEAHACTLPPHYPEFDHYQPAEFLFQQADEGTKLPGFDEALGRMAKLIDAVNALMA